MKFERMEIVGVQVHDLDAAVELFTGLLGLEFRMLVPGEDYSFSDSLDGSDQSAPLVGPGSRVAIDTSGYMELVEVPQSDEGLRNFHVKVDDLEAAKSLMASRGVRLVRDVVAGGVKEAIFHSEDLCGVRLCIVEYEGESLVEALVRSS